MSEIDKDMMRALEADAAMLEAMGAGPQPLAFEGHAVGMRLVDAAQGHWDVYDAHGNILGHRLSLDAADAMIAGKGRDHE